MVLQNSTNQKSITRSNTDNSKNTATTEYVNNKISGIGGSSPNTRTQNWTPGSSLTNSLELATLGEFQIGGVDFEPLTQWNIICGFNIYQNSGSNVFGNFFIKLDDTTLISNENNTGPLTSKPNLKSCRAEINITAVTATRLSISVILRVGLGITIDYIDQGNDWDHTGEIIVDVDSLSSVRTLSLKLNVETAHPNITITPRYASLLEIKPSNAILLSKLNDTAINNPQNNQPIQYNSATNKWENNSFIGIPSIDYNLLPTNLGSTARGFVFCPDHPFGAGVYQWSGSFWIPLSSLFDNSYSYSGFRPGSGSSLITYGNIGAAAGGTVSTPTLSNSDSISRQDRTSFATSATAGSVAFLRTGYVYAKAGGLAGTGGYRFRIGFGLGALQSGMRSQVGLLATATSPTNTDPVNQNAAKIALAISANTGNWQLVHSSGGAPTIIDLGPNFPVNSTTWFTWQLNCLPNSTSIPSIVTNTETGQQDVRTLSTNLPAQATQLCPVHWVTNNTTAAIASIMIGRWDLEFK